MAKVLNTYLGADPLLIQLEHYLRFRSNLWGLSSYPIAATRVGLVTAVAQIDMEFFHREKDFLLQFDSIFQMRQVTDDGYR